MKKTVRVWVGSREGRVNGKAQRDVRVLARDATAGPTTTEREHVLVSHEDGTIAHGVELQVVPLAGQIYDVRARSASEARDRIRRYLVEGTGPEPEDRAAWNRWCDAREGISEVKP